MLIKSYKFIATCNNNLRSAFCVIKSLQKHVAIEAGDNYHKTLYLAINKINYQIDKCYDKTNHRQSEDELELVVRDLSGNESDYSDMSRKCSLDIETSMFQKNVRASKRKEVSKQVCQSYLREPNLSNNKTSYSCEDCSTEYKTAKYLNYHYLKVHAPKTFACTQCPRSFGSHGLLNDHIKSSHCGAAACGECGKTYTNTFSLRNHMKTHKVLYKCQICSKVFRGKPLFYQRKCCENNIRKIISGPKLTCKFCNKIYSTSAGLKFHTKMHESGKAVICDWCGNKFGSVSVLREHIKKHTKLRNFQCDICGRKVITKSALVTHLRLHTGEKPYKCNYCEMTFMSSGRRYDHVKSQHDGPPLECDICHRKFKGYRLFKAHKKRHLSMKTRLTSLIINEND